MFIKELRNRLGLTQNEFAERFGIPVRTVQQWEQGRQEPPSYVVELIKKTILLEEELEKIKKENSPEA